MEPNYSSKCIFEHLFVLIFQYQPVNLREVITFFFDIQALLMCNLLLFLEILNVESYSRFSRFVLYLIKVSAFYRAYFVKFAYNYLDYIMQIIMK